MPSPAQIHYQKAMAREAAKAKETSDAPVRDHGIDELMLGQLAQHKRVLKEVKSTERKAAKKAEFIPEYLGYIEGVLEADTGEPNEVMTTLMLWAIDTGNFELAIKIGEYAIPHLLPMPAAHTRDAATALVEELADYSLRHQAEIDEEEVGYLLSVYELTDGMDMFDQVLAKLNKAIGYGLMDIRPEDAVAHWDRALELDPHSGVKKVSDKLRKQVNKAANEAAAQAAATPEQNSTEDDESASDEKEQTSDPDGSE